MGIEEGREGGWGVLKEFTQGQISAVMLTQFQFGMRLYLMLPVSLFHSRTAAEAAKQHPLHTETTQPDQRQRKIRKAK